MYPLDRKPTFISLTVQGPFSGNSARENSLKQPDFKVPNPAAATKKYGCADAADQSMLSRSSVSVGAVFYLAAMAILFRKRVMRTIWRSIQEIKYLRPFGPQALVDLLYNKSTWKYPKSHKTLNLIYLSNPA